MKLTPMIPSLPVIITPTAMSSRNESLERDLSRSASTPPLRTWTNDSRPSFAGHDLNDTGFSTYKLRSMSRARWKTIKARESQCGIGMSFSRSSGPIGAVGKRVIPWLRLHKPNCKSHRRANGKQSKSLLALANPAMCRAF